MKKGKYLLTFFVLSFFLAGVSGITTKAANSEQAAFGNYTYTVSAQGNVTITAYTGLEASVSIPSQIDGKPVTRIGKNAFQGNTVITEITIPYGVKTIGEYAFRDCTGLETIYYQCELSNIETLPFKGCTNLRTLKIGSQVESVWQSSDGLLMGENLESYEVDPDNPYSQ